MCVSSSCIACVCRLLLLGCRLPVQPQSRFRLNTRCTGRPYSGRHRGDCSCRGALHWPYRLGSDERAGCPWRGSCAPQHTILFTQVVALSTSKDEGDSSNAPFKAALARLFLPRPRTGELRCPRRMLLLSLTVTARHGPAQAPQQRGDALLSRRWHPARGCRQCQ